MKKVGPALAVLSLATALVATAAPASARPAATVAIHYVSASDATPTVGDQVYISGRLSGTDEHTLQIQTRHPGGQWHVAKTFRDLISFYKPVTFRSAGTFNLRVVSLAGSGYSKAISRAITLHVQPHFPVVAVNGNSIDARIDAHTRFRDDIGGALYDSSITTCTDYGDGQPYCTTDRPTNGQYLTVPITITQEQGTHDYNRFNYSLKGPDGQVWDQTYEDTKHGQQLSSGTLTAPDYVSGVVVFDVPPGSGYRLLVEDFGDSLGQVYV